MNRIASLLLKNQSWKQILVKNTVWTGVAEGSVRLLKVVITMLLVRMLGPGGYGDFAFAFAFASMFGIVVDGGVMLVATREFASSTEKENLLSNFLTLKLLLGLAGVTALVAVTWWTTNISTTRMMILILGLYLLSGELGSLVFALIRAHQRMEYEAAGRMVQSAIFFVAVGIVLWLSPSALNVSFAHLAAGIISLVFIWLAYFRWQGRIPLRLSWQNVWELLRKIIPLALAGVCSTLYINIDSVLLGFWGSTVEVGWYNAAIKTIHSIVILPMNLLLLAALPTFTSMANQVNEDFHRRWNSWSSGVMAIGVYIGIVAIAYADMLVRFFFGDAFSPSVPVLQIVTLTGILMYLYMPYYQALVIFNKQSYLVRGLFIGLILNIMANVILIPIYGMYGAAVANVVTHLVILILLWYLCSENTPLSAFTMVALSALLRTVFAGALAYLVFVSTIDRLWLSILLGTVIYGVCIWGLARIPVPRKPWVSMALSGKDPL